MKSMARSFRDPYRPAAGGPLALLENRDTIEIGVAKRIADLSKSAA
jgi:hypothetical protein